MAKKKSKSKLQEELGAVTERMSVIAGIFNIPFEELSSSEITERLRIEFAQVLVGLKDLAKVFDLDWIGKRPSFIVQSAVEAVRKLTKQSADAAEAARKLTKQNAELRKEVHEYKSLSFPRKHEEAREEVAKERGRYNDLLGLRIRQDPRFQNLNDAGRPDKVITKFQDICNQERLDAADELEEEKITTDMETLDLLSRVMQESRKVAQGILDHKLKKLSEILAEVDVIGAEQKQESTRVGDGMRMEVMHELKAKDPTPFESKICQEVTDHFKEKYPKFGRKGSEVEMFTKACGEVSWMIVLTTPAMTLDAPAECTFDPKRHVLFPECRVQEGAQITKCLWPALRFNTQETPEVKAHVFTNLSEKRPPQIPGIRRSWRQRSKEKDCSKPAPARMNSCCCSSDM